MKFLWTDDKTHRFSDTTLRAWLLFFLFFFTALAMIIFELVSPGSISERAIVLLDVTVVAAGSGGALYLGKRVNERNHVVTSVGNVTISGPRDQVYARPPVDPTAAAGGAP